MNKHLIVIGIFVLLLVVGLNGCIDLMPDIGGISDGYDEDFKWAESDFVGTWKLTFEGNDRTECELIIKNNGHFTKNCITGERSDTTAGRWFLRDIPRDYDHEPFTFFCTRPENNYVSEQKDYRFEWINKDKVILDYDEWNFESPSPNWILMRI